MKTQTEQAYISFEEFCKLESVQELLLNLRGSKHKFLKPNTKSGLYLTQLVYANKLYHLHKWLTGKPFEFNNFVHTGANSFKNERQKIVLKGLEDLLRHYQNSFNSRRDFVILLKRYLNDPVHEKKRASSMTVTKSAILAYFKHNESGLIFHLMQKGDTRHENQKMRKSSYLWRIC